MNINLPKTAQNKKMVLKTKVRHKTDKQLIEN